MAKLGQIVTQPGGSELILTREGWVPNTPELETASAMGIVGAVGQGIAESVTLGMMPDGGQGEALRQVSPIATNAPMAAELALGAGGLARAGVRQVAKGRMADRVAQRVSEQGELLRRPSDMMNPGTAGNRVARGIEGAMEATPGLNIPLIMQKMTNQRKVNMSLAKGIGASDDMVEQARYGVTEDVLDDAFKNFERGFNDVERSITSGIRQVDAMPVVDQAIESKFITGRLKQQLESGRQITGKELMQVRSKLSGVLRSNSTFMEKEAAAEIVDQIDEIIEATMDDAGAKAYQELRSRYRLWSAAKRGESIGMDGQVNVRSLGSRLKASTGYGDDYMAGRDIAGAADDVNDFLRLSREARSLAVGLPDSGTAERAAGMILGGAALSGLTD